MRLLLVSQDFPPAVGGVQTWADRLARALSRTHEVTVLAPAARGAASLDAALPCPVERWPTLHTSAFGAVTPLALPLAAARSGARIALCAQVATAGAALLAVRLGLLDRYYVAAHGREILWTPLGAPQRRWRSTVLAGAAAVFAVSRFTARAVRQLGVPAARVEVVPNGVDLDRFGPVDAAPLRRRLGLPGRRIVLSAGRLVPRKGVDTLIAAFTALRARVPEATLVVAGEGPDRGRLAALAQDRHVPVRFLGRVPDDDLRALYALADVFVLAAREEPGGDVEGFGLVLLEAAACGTPCVASRSGGVPDAVDEGRSGLLVPPGDPAALALALARVLGDARLRAKLAAGALDRAARSTWEESAARVRRRMALDEAERLRRCAA